MQDKNIYNAINNLYNMDSTTWQEVLATLYNYISNIENGFKELESRFGILLPIEVKNAIQKLVDDGTLASLINGTLLTNINTKVDETNKKLSEISRVDIRQFGVLADGTDQTAKILEVFQSGLLANFEGFIIMPYGVKFDKNTIYTQTPTGIILEDYSLNSYKSSTYRRKHFGFISGGDYVSNDSIFTVQSGHHPAIALNNFKRSNSESNTKAMNSILFCDGFQTDGTIEPYYHMRTMMKENKYIWSMSIQKLYATQEKRDSTVFQIDEDGRMLIGGGLNVKNMPWDTTTSSNIEVENKNVGASVGLKCTNDTSNFHLREVNGNSYFLHNNVQVWSTDDDAFKMSKEKASFRNISGADLTVNNGRYFIVSNSSATTLTSITGDNAQVITLIFKDGNTTIPKSLVKLKGNVDWTPTTNSSITLIKHTSLTSAWIEIGRTEI